ncbi:MAG: response regulator transcription factor [Actinomycetota bacterium]|nr:MAG: response regulator transcription factor [Actinomycetota bacterium]
MTRVLLAEDDPDIAVPLTRVLQREGYEVAVVATGGAALAAVRRARPAVVLLDLGLPDMDGLDVCRRLRGAGDDIAILILTARADPADLVVSLDAGADDYVSKPFRTPELLARVRALVRRSTAPDVVQTGLLRIDPAARRVRIGDHEIALTPKEFELLLVLATKHGTTISREQLVHDVWHVTWAGATKTVDVHVSALRRKLAYGAEPGRRGNPVITTVRGIGYRLDVDGLTPSGRRTRSGESPPTALL